MSSDYDAERFRKFVAPLLEQRNESTCQASVNAGLHIYALDRFFDGEEPTPDACVALAKHVDVPPNEMLEASGYEPLDFFDSRLIDPNAEPVTFEEIHVEIMKIEDAEVRQEMLETFNAIVGQ
jgi:hypothetical protein